MGLNPGPSGSKTCALPYCKASLVCQEGKQNGFTPFSLVAMNLQETTLESLGKGRSQRSREPHITDPTYDEQVMRCCLRNLHQTKVLSEGKSHSGGNMTHASTVRNKASSSFLPCKHVVGYRFDTSLWIPLPSGRGQTEALQVQTPNS